MIYIIMKPLTITTIMELYNLIQRSIFMLFYTTILSKIYSPIEPTKIKGKYGGVVNTV